jgi:hypothetical protein
MIHEVTQEQLEHIKRWVEDLETTKAPQAQAQLRHDRAYCCLGRLCVVEKIKYNSGDPYPPLAVIGARTGLRIIELERYANFNDQDRLSFKEIAAWVRKDFDLGKN